MGRPPSRPELDPPLLALLEVGGPASAQTACRVVLGDLTPRGVQLVRRRLEAMHRDGAVRVVRSGRSGGADGGRRGSTPRLYALP